VIVSAHITSWLAKDRQRELQAEAERQRIAIQAAANARRVARQPHITTQPARQGIRRMLRPGLEPRP
jgi:hypothetical protein